jgi:hypothetical protein
MSYSPKCPEIDGLNGGGKGIRTLETLWNSMGRIRPKVGSIFGPKEANGAEENWLGAGFDCSGISPISFFRYVQVRNWGDIEPQPNVCGSNIPLLGGRSVINFVYFRGLRLFFNDCAAI